MEAVADDTVSRWFSDEFVRRGDAEPLRRTIAAMTVQGFETCARALQSYAYGDVLPAIACPTLLVAGSNDGAMPANMAALSKRIAGAHFVEIPGAGHIPNLEKPEAFNRVLLEFLR
jgi:3-oxoadipate enol-lactonase